MWIDMFRGASEVTQFTLRVFRNQEGRQRYRHLSLAVQINHIEEKTSRNALKSNYISSILDSKTKLGATAIKLAKETPMNEKIAATNYIAE